MSFLQSIQWGILGTGSIAGQFCRSMQEVSDGEVIACASMTSGKAQAFSEKWGISMAFSSYQECLQNPEVDVVYVANTHNFHFETVRSALQAGKSVLCEKPLTTSAVAARELQQMAEENGQFLMEGMWTRFLPAMQQVRTWIEEGMIGRPQFLRADFCFSAAVNPESRLFYPALAGGAVWDVGIYPLSIARFLLREDPDILQAVLDIGETCVEEQAAWCCR